MKPKELQADIEWLEELLATQVRVGKDHPHAEELRVEIQRVRERLANYDYSVRESWKARHFQEKGEHNCDIF